MNTILSIIIPSYNRDELLINNLNNIINNFNHIEFHNYEIIVIHNGQSKQSSQYIFNKFLSHSNVKFFTFENQLAPGIARNIGVEKCQSKWIWFIDDDDQIIFKNINTILKIIEDTNTEIDLIAHSLKFQYTDEDKEKLINKILLFQEKQEVFRFIFQKTLLIKNKIKFSDGLHEDIRYTIELLLNSNRIKIINEIIYNKFNNELSITNELTTNRLDGYLNAAKEILCIQHVLIQQQNNNFVTQLLGTLLYLIDKSPTENKLKFITYLDYTFTSDFKKYIINTYTSKNTNFKYAVSLYLNKTDNIKFIEELNNCFNTYLSCKDLKHSIFLGPQEIIGCCKRFFHKGRMKGDVVLLKNVENITLNTILDRKKQIEDLINSDSYDECEGCPYIERFSKNNNEKINYISLENFNYCNMKCSYCSPKYYGGRESSYDSDNIILDLVNSKILDDNVHVVWGGGEPTLSLKFNNITSNLLNCDKINKIRVLSNSLKFSNDLYNVASNKKIRIVTSIDAGTQTQFQKIRGKGNLIQVLENLQKYNTQIPDSENLTLKYIITDDNFHSDEIQEFVKLVKKYKFENNFIQISCNFSYEKLENKIIFAIYELAARLLNNGFNFIYFDDLIRDRLILNNNISDEIINYLNKNNIFHENILSYHSSKYTILWGDGYQSKWIKNNTTYGKSGKVLKIITNEFELNSLLSNENVIVCPAAVQQLPEVYKNIKNIKLLNNKLKFGIFI